jgi:hypothetical protein
MALGTVDDWRDMMSSVVTYEPVATRDDYGKPATYGLAVSYRGHMSYRTTRVRSRVDGHDVLASGQLIVGGVIAGLGQDDRITLPDGSVRAILNWATYTDEAGPHHTTIYFGASLGTGT